MREALDITKDERRAVENALAGLEQAYTEGRILRGAYLMRKELLESNLQRTTHANTSIEQNAQGFFNRNELNLSARPIGYEDRNITEGFTNRARPNEIRRALIEMSTTDYQASIMDHLRENKSANHEYTNAIEHATTLLGGIDQATYPDIWNEISTKPGVISALQRLANAVQSRIQGAIQQGMSPESAEVYIINNARAAGASLSQEGYDRHRASEIVQRVISGEISLIAASNMVVGDLNEASKAILASNPDYVLNPKPTHANSTQLARMSLKDIVETRETALTMLQDPLSYDEELQWAAQFIQEADIAISQRETQKDAIIGNSTNQILVSTDPANYSLMESNAGLPSTLQTTREAMQGGPNLDLVLNDIFTVDGITYYDHRTDKFTVVAETSKAYPVFEEVVRALNYALGSPYFADEQRAILEAVRRRVTSHMGTLANYSPPHGRPIPPSNNPSINNVNTTNQEENDKVLSNGKPTDNPFQWNVYDLEDKKVKGLKKEKVKSLGASTSTTTSSRTSGAHRFTANEDPRDRHRME